MTTVLDLRPRLRLELAENAAGSRIFLVPGPDDWFADETDISRFVTEARVFAKVGDPTRAELSIISLSAAVETSNPPVSRWRFCR
jgi:hypothetical protein